MKVGRTYPGKKKAFKYKDVEYDLEGWADATKYYPADFDLVLIQLKDKKNPVSAWCMGKKWEGARIKGDEEVMRWKIKKVFFSDE